MVVEAEAEAELPLDHAGLRLLRAREAAGLSRAQVAAETKIPERHLAAIEAGEFAALPARTYAVGFSRSYAKAVGLDDKAIVEAVREELAGQAMEPAHRGVPMFEPGDPARVPSSAVAWLAALLALGLIVAGLFLGWKTYFAPAGSLPPIVVEASPAAASPPSDAAPAIPAGSGPVIFTATAPGIWVKFYDGAGNQLLQKELAQGESYTVPPTMADVRLWTARPEALAITIAGQPVAPLATAQVMMKDVPVTAAALLARSPAANGANSSAPVSRTNAATAPRRTVAQPVPASPGNNPNRPSTASSPTPEPAGAQIPAQPSANQAEER